MSAPSSLSIERRPGRRHELAAYVIEQTIPRVAMHNPYLALLEAVIDRQAALIAQWMQIGFIEA